MKKKNMMDDNAFFIFYKFYPLETYAKWPTKFWKFFHAEFPNISLAQMKRMLKETEEPEKHREKVKCRQ